MSPSRVSSLPAYNTNDSESVSVNSSSTISASATIRSCNIRPTTVLITTLGPMLARCLSEARRTRTGKVPIAFLATGVELNGRKYRKYINGYNMLDYLSGKSKESPRSEFWYVNDDGEIFAARYQDWKVVFLGNRGEAFGVWREPFVELPVPLIFNLCRDPFERAQHNSNTYNDWFLDRPFIIVPLQGLAAKFLLTMKDYSSSQSPGSFLIRQRRNCLR